MNSDARGEQEQAWSGLDAENMPHPAGAAPPMVGILSDPGLEREKNEDAAWVWLQHKLSYLGGVTLGLFIVADGMGGHAAGELASQIAVEEASTHLLKELLLPMLGAGGPTSPGVSIHEAMESAFAAAHARVQNETPGGATTLTVALLMDRRLYVGHAGDCRIYRLRGGNLELLTRDHSLLNRLIELGHIDQERPQELDRDPRRNALYRALGQNAPLELDLTSHTLEEGDGLLLCTDGLWSMVPKEEMARILLDASSPAGACRELIETANAHGGTDNITVIFVYPIGEMAGS